MFHLKPEDKEKILVSILVSILGQASNGTQQMRHYYYLSLPSSSRYQGADIFPFVFGKFGDSSPQLSTTIGKLPQKI